jgi:DNA-binding CsgD family transcriptional regulator/tetratricopeptide (TPR) repeat protein
VIRASFIGRDHELTALDEARDSVESGRGRLLLIGGETGVGKSRLVAEFRARSEARGQRVLQAGAVEMLGGAVPYELVLDLLLEAGESPALLSTLLPVVAAPALDTGADPGLARMRLLGPLMKALLELCANGPLTLVLEDLHWADPSSLDAMTWLINRLPRLPLLLVGTYRTTDVDPAHPLRRVLAQISHHSIVTRIDLEPFSRAEVVALARDMLGDEFDPMRVDEVYRRSQGNAFFAEELLVAGGTSGLSSDVHELLLSRVHLLTSQARRVLNVTALAGDDVPEQVISEASALAPDELDAALRVLRDAHMLVPGSSGSGYRLRHSLLGEAIVADLLDGERRRWHAALADALSRSPAEQSDSRRQVRMAHHLYEAGDLERALTASRDAAAALQRSYAYAESCQLYHRALGLARRLSRGPEELVPLLEQAAEAARWSGRTDLAVEHLRAAIDLAEHDDARRQERLGQALWESGQTVPAQEAYVRADQLTAGQRGEVRARVLAEQARHRLLEGHFRDARELCEESIELAREAGADGTLAGATVSLGVAEALSGKVEDGLARLQAIRDRVASGDPVDLLVRAFGNSTAVLGYLGRLDEAVEVSRVGLLLLRERGLDPAAGRGILTNAANAFFWRGLWDEAEQLIHEVLDRPVPSRHEPFLRLTLGEIAVARGAFDEAEQHLRYCRDRAEQLRENQLVTPTLAALTALHLWRGESDVARDVATGALSRLPETEQEDYGVTLCALALRACADLAEINGSRHASAALQREAEGLVTRAEAFCDQLRRRGGQLPECQAAVGLARAEYARLTGGDVVERAREAAESWDRLQRPFLAAYARWRQGQALLLHRRAGEAEPVLRRSLAAAATLRSQPLADAVAATLRAARLDPSPPAPVDAGPPVAGRRGEPGRAKDKLTLRELEVLQFAARGKTNKEIGRSLYISDRTVGIHLSHIMEKLGARNRLEAVQVAHRRGILGRSEE